MGVSNIRKLKKKYKSQAVAGIEGLIVIYKEKLIDTTDLEKTLNFCKSIRPGNFGKRVYPNISDFTGIQTNWKIKDDFCEFASIHRRFLIRLISNENYYSGTMLATTNFQSYQGLIENVEKHIEKIDTKYRAEHRDLLIDSLLDD